jgi:hypothetical protein
MTKRVNTLSRIAFLAGIFLEVIFSFRILASDQAASNLKPEPLPFRKIQLLQVPAEKLNFALKTFKAQWITSEADWKNLWKKSRMEGEAIKLPVQWMSESVLAIFWESKDAVVRIPSFVGADIDDVNGVRQMKLTFNLTTPCFGIISDSSPAQLLVIDRSLGDVDKIIVHTETTRATNCY